MREEKDKTNVFRCSGLPVTFLTTLLYLNLSNAHHTSVWPSTNFSCLATVYSPPSDGPGFQNQRQRGLDSSSSLNLASVCEMRSQRDRIVLKSIDVFFLSVGAGTDKTLKSLLFSRRFLHQVRGQRMWSRHQITVQHDRTQVTTQLLVWLM